MAENSYRITTWDEQTSHYVTITEADFAAIKTAKSNLLEALFIEEKMDIAIENYLELENELLTSSTRRMVQFDFSYISAQSERNLFSRRIVNLLSTCRGYLDQTRHHISNIYGGDSSVVAEFNAARKEQYDSRLGYRVMEALRNYVQHRGAPLRGVSYDHRAVEFTDGSKLRYSTKVLMSVQDLSEDRKFSRTVLGELKGMGTEIDLSPFVREYVAGLSVVHQKLRDTLRPNVANWELEIRNAMERFRTEFPNEAAQGNIFAMSTDEEVWLSRDLLMLGEALSRKT